MHSKDRFEDEIVFQEITCSFPEQNAPYLKLQKVLMDAYWQARNRVNSLNIQLKRQYFSAKISNCKGNMKESWKTVNELLNKRSKSCNIYCL